MKKGYFLGPPTQQMLLKVSDHLDLKNLPCLYGIHLNISDNMISSRAYLHYKGFISTYHHCLEMSSPQQANIVGPPPAPSLKKVRENGCHAIPLLSTRVICTRNRYCRSLSIYPNKRERQTDNDVFFPSSTLYKFYDPDFLWVKIKWLDHQISFTC